MGWWYYGIVASSLLITHYLLTAALTWYRLRKLPVPSALAHFSYIWLGWTTYRGRQYWVYRELHRRYGPVVRIGPKEVMIDAPDILRFMSAARSHYSRGQWYLTGRFNPYHDNIFTVLDNMAHKKARARVFAGYSGHEAYQSLERGVDAQIARLKDLLRRKYCADGNDAPVLDIGTVSTYFTMDVITRLAFGNEAGYLEDRDVYGFTQELRHLWPWMSLSADVPWLRKLTFSKPCLKLFGPRPTDSHGFGALMGVSQRHVREKFAYRDEQNRDMVDSFIRHGMTEKECEAESLFTIVAGSESTASAIRSIIVHTVSCPRAYSKLKLEIGEALDNSMTPSPVRLEEIKAMPYLQSIVYEGIRMRPPILGLFPKVVPKGGAEFYGYFLPAGTNICANMSSLLRSKSLFGEDSDVFRPERFSDPQVGDECRRRMWNDIDLAFGHGQHQCLGKHIALMELMKITFELFRDFDFQLVSPWCPNDEVLSYGVFLESILVRVSTVDWRYNPRTAARQSA